MNEKQLITEQDRFKDLSRNIVVAASSIIPGIGGVLSLFLDNYLPNSIEKRRDDFLLSLSNDLEQLPTHIVEKLTVSEEYHSLVLKVFKSIIQEEKEIKITAFRNILINAALSDKNIDEQEFYIKLLTDLTTDQVKILHLFYLRDNKHEIRFTDIYKYISDNWSKVDESYRFALITELIRYGLISGAQKYQKKKGDGHYLSPFGERFIYFIFQPRETNDTMEILNNDE